MGELNTLDETKIYLHKFAKARDWDAQYPPDTVKGRAKKLRIASNYLHALALMH